MRVRWSVAWIGAAAIVMMGVDLGARIFGTNDEARFPLLAQAVLEQGEWFFPRINGVVYHTKPLLLPWLIAAVSAPLGSVTQLTAVLPSALAAVATVLVVHQLGSALFGAAAGRGAALAAMTTSGLFFHGRLAMPDMPLVFCMTASLAGFWVMLGERPGVSWVAFYGFAVVGFWVKGLPGLLPLLVGPVCGLLAHRVSSWRRLHLGVGVPLVLVLVVPWWILQFGHDRDEMRSLVLYDQLYWYLPNRLSASTLMAPLRNLGSILFPWILLAPAVVLHAARALRDRGEGRDRLAFVAGWAALMLVFAAASKEQRLRYWVQLVPPVALLVGHWCAAPHPASTRRRVPWAVYVVLALAGQAVALYTVRGRVDGQLATPSSLGEMLALATGLTAMVAALAYGAAHDGRSAAMGVAALGAGVVLVAGYHGQLGRHNRAYDYPGLQAAVRDRAPTTPLVAAWGVHEMPLTFYGRAPVVSVDGAAALHAALRGRGPAAAVVTDKNLGALPEVAVLLHGRIALRPISVVTAPPR